MKPFNNLYNKAYPQKEIWMKAWECEEKNVTSRPECNTVLSSGNG